MYLTISKSELGRLNNLNVKDLHYYKDLFQRVIVGRKADIEFYELQTKNGSGYVFDGAFRKQLDTQIVFFTERLEVINKRLDEKGLKELKTSIN